MSEAMKKTVMLELTVPWEDPMEKANEWMREKYEGYIYMYIAERCRVEGPGGGSLVVVGFGLRTI